MILPIYAYGQSVLRKKASPIAADYDGLEQLIADMWETMYAADGVGLAAPQIGRSIRLFVVDSQQMMDEGEQDQGIKQVFINAEIIREEGEEWAYEEGCLSIPDITGDVLRPATVTLRYQDETLAEHEKTFTGLTARVIQHEYDHVEGRLFTEKLKPLRRKMIQRKLDKIKKGEITAKYYLKFAR